MIARAFMISSYERRSMVVLPILATLAYSWERLIQPYLRGAPPPGK